MKADDIFPLNETMKPIPNKALNHDIERVDATTRLLRARVIVQCSINVNVNYLIVRKIELELKTLPCNTADQLRCILNLKSVDAQNFFHVRQLSILTSV